MNPDHLLMTETFSGVTGPPIHCSADSRFVLSQWETALLCNDVSHWLGPSLESDLHWTLRNLGYQFICHRSMLFPLRQLIDFLMLHGVNKTGSAFVLVIASCLTVPGHYQNMSSVNSCSIIGRWFYKKEKKCSRHETWITHLKLATHLSEGD